MFGEKEISDIDLSVKENNLYLEEFFTDLDMASIRRLTPVKPNGLRDKSRKLVFVDLKEAMERYPEAMKHAFGEMQEKIKKLQQEKESKIIVP